MAIKSKKIIAAALLACGSAISVGCSNTQPNEEFKDWVLVKPSSTSTGKVQQDIPEKEYIVGYLHDENSPTPKTFKKNAGEMILLDADVSTPETKARELAVKEGVGQILDARTEQASAISNAQNKQGLNEAEPLLESSNTSSVSNDFLAEINGESLTKEEVGRLLDESDSETLLVDDGVIALFRVDSYFLSEKQKEVVLESIAKAKTSGVTEATVTGYASPDGPIYWNKFLAEKRAETTAKFIKNHFDIKVTIVEAGGESFLKDKAARVFFK